MSEPLKSLRSRRSSSRWRHVPAASAEMRRGDRAAGGDEVVTASREWRSAHGLRRASAAGGRRTGIPRPGTEATLISPPMASTSRFEIERPRPVPPKSRLVSALAWVNSSNTRLKFGRRSCRSRCLRPQCGGGHCLRWTDMATAAFRCEFDGIAAQVEKHLAQPLFITEDLVRQHRSIQSRKFRCPWHGRAAPEARSPIPPATADR